MLVEGHRWIGPAVPASDIGLKDCWVDIIEPLDTLVSGTIPVTISQAYRYEGESGRVSQRQTRYHLAGTTYAFITGFSYDDLGNMSQIDYPRCLHHGCVGDDPPRTVDFGHTRGYLSSVPGFASSLTYQRGGMLHKVSHTNSVVETIAVDPTYPFDRPYRISTSGVTNGNWNTGVYAYDGSGNIRGIDDESYRYDRMSRLVSGQVDVGGASKTQSLTYDAYGNLLSLTTDGTTQPTATSSTTNRLTEASLSPVYDAGGNLADVTLGGEHYLYTYDPLNMIKHLQSTTDQARVFLYDADDERVMTFDCALVECDTQTSHLTTTIRGLDAKVLRVYNLDFGESWEWVRDYVHRGGQLLAAVEADNTLGEVTRHLHLDHLGSPRQITDEAAAQVAFHTYYPFGGEATDPGQDEFQLKFTGHERDGNGSAGVGILDYMHARYYSPYVGRFFSSDPAVLRVPADRLQRWNRYSYSNNNPAKFLDPNGKTAIIFVIGPNYDKPETSFGHAAILATSGDRRATASEGTPTVLEPRVSDFVNTYLDQERVVTAFVLSDDQKRDAALVEALDPSRRKSYNEFRQNCATTVCDALRAAGVLGKDERPERGLIFDSPEKLQESLESGALSKYVSRIVIFYPWDVQEVYADQIPGLLLIEDVPAIPPR